MVFRPDGTRTFKLRVDHPDGRRVTLTTGCVDKRDAEDVESAVHKWQGRRGKRYARPDVIDALVEKRISLPDAFEADAGGTLDALLGKHAASEPSIDLTPLLQEWVDDKKKSRKGAGQAEVYRD